MNNNNKLRVSANDLLCDTFRPFLDQTTRLTLQ